jgi:hypothetical protein
MKKPTHPPKVHTKPFQNRAVKQFWLSSHPKSPLLLFAFIVASSLRIAIAEKIIVIELKTITICFVPFFISDLFITKKPRAGILLRIKATLVQNIE